MRPLTFGRGIWDFSDNTEDSCPKARPLKATDAASSNLGTQYECFMEIPSLFDVIRKNLTVNPRESVAQTTPLLRVDPRLRSSHRALLQFRRRSQGRDRRPVW